jgi:hypothetical protein
VPYRFRRDELHIERNEAATLVYYVVEDPRTHVQHRFYPIEYEVAQLLDGKRTTDKVARLISKKMDLRLEQVDVDSFAQQLLALGFAEDVE